jgi:hypothetical protein
MGAAEAAVTTESRKPGRDLRAYARSTQVRLILGGLLIILVVGNGLIWLIYGTGAALLALSCTGIGLAPGLLIVIWLWTVDWIVRRARGD